MRRCLDLWLLVVFFVWGWASILAPGCTALRGVMR
jgi:hypothetical protein